MRFSDLKKRGIKGAIFDIDGTVIDSMPMWDRAGVVFLEKHGIKGDEDLGKILFPLTIDDTALYIKKHYNLAMSSDEIKREINDIMREFYRREAHFKKGMKELLKEMHDGKIIMSVATSTDRDVFMPCLKRLGIVEYFDEIYTCTEVGKSKSEPDIFYRAMAKMGTKPEHTWLFEDGLYSAKTAKKLGIKIVGVYDETSRHDWEELSNLADLTIEYSR